MAKRPIAPIKGKEEDFHANREAQMEMPERQAVEVFITDDRPEGLRLETYEKMVYVTISSTELEFLESVLAICRDSKQSAAIPGAMLSLKQVYPEYRPEVEQISMAVIRGTLYDRESLTIYNGRGEERILCVKVITPVPHNRSEQKKPSLA